MIPPRRSAPVAILLVAVLLGRFNVGRFEGIDHTSVWLAPRYWVAASLAIGLLATRTLRRAAPMTKLQRRYLVAVTSLFGLVALSALWGQPRPVAAADVLDVMLIPIFAWESVEIFRQSPHKTLPLLFRWLLIAAVIYLLGAALGIGRFGNERLQAFYGGPNVFVRVMGVGMIAAAYFFVRERKVLWLLAIPPLGLSALLSGSRGGVLALFTVGVLAVWAMRRHLSGARLAVGTIALLFSSVLFSIPVGNQVGSFVEDRYYELTLRAGYKAGRNELFSAAVDLYREHPVVGAGLSGYAAAQPISSSIDKYPHNMVLEVAAETGTVGVVLLAAALGVGVVAVRRARSGDLAIEVAFCGLAAAFYVVASQFSGGYFDTRFVWVFLGAATAAAPSADRALGRTALRGLPR